MNEPNQLPDTTTAGFDMNLTADDCVDISAKEAIVGGRLLRTHRHRGLYRGTHREDKGLNTQAV